MLISPARDVDRVHPLLERRGRQQGTAQGLGQLARVLFERLGQLHGGCTGKVAVAATLGDSNLRPCRQRRATGVPARRPAAKQFCLTESIG